MSVAASGPAVLPVARVASVAFCPCPPLLVPEVEGRSAPETEALRAACAAALSALLGAAPDVVLVVGSADDDARFGPGDVGDLGGFGVDLRLPFAGPAGSAGARVPLAHTVGAWLLDAAGFAGRRIGIGPSAVTPVLADLSGRIGILAMGAGSARRTAKAPGYLDAAAGPFDAAVAVALAAGNADALAALDAAEGERLLADGTTTWRAVGSAVRGARITGRLHYDEAPFGVGYLVADWQVA